eukprot:5562426-Alexandrium_andersonii.AAC.1
MDWRYHPSHEHAERTGCDSDPHWHRPLRPQAAEPVCAGSRRTGVRAAAGGWRVHGGPRPHGVDRRTAHAGGLR